MEDVIFVYTKFPFPSFFSSILHTRSTTHFTLLVCNLKTYSDENDINKMCITQSKLLFTAAAAAALGGVLEMLATTGT